MTTEQIRELMGADASDAEAAAMIEILKARGITDLDGVDQLSDKEFNALIPEAIQRAADRLPVSVLARWDKEDWDDDRMVARHYRYYDLESGDEIELTEEEASQYSWGQTEDNITGGSQTGRIEKETKMTKLTGYEAIHYAEAHGLTLSKYTDPTEDAREGVTPEEARKIASEDPSLIHIEVEETK